MNPQQSRGNSILDYILSNQSGIDYESKRFRDLFKRCLCLKTEDKTLDNWNTNPGTPKSKISDTTEKAFQRAIYNQSEVEAEFPDGAVKKLRWLDYELPVIPGPMSRRSCCDLVVEIDNEEHTICEVKYKKPPASGSGNEADYAIFEVLLQFASILFHAEKLDGVHHKGNNEQKFSVFSWNDITTARRVLVAANKAWWKNTRIEANKERVRRLVESVKEYAGIDLFLFEIEDITFAEQKAKALIKKEEVYTPAWPESISNKWLPALP